MKPLQFRTIENLESDRADFLRRTRTVCVYSGDRPEIASKSLVKITAKSENDSVTVDGVFCVDALGSKKGILLGHPSHFRGLENDTEVIFSIAPASAQDCVRWLEENDDPERKAFAHILQNTLEASDETQRISKLTQETLETTRKNLEKAEQFADIAQKDRAAATIDRKIGAAFGAAGFILGALLDVGMLEEKFGINITAQSIGILFLATIAIFILAPKIVKQLV